MLSLNPKKWFSKGLVNGSKTRTFEIKDISSFMSYVAGGGGRVTASKAAEWYRTVSAVATSVDMIGEAVEKITPVILEKDGKYIYDHPLLDFLKEPNSREDWVTFIGTVTRDYLLKHDSLIVAAGNIKFEPVEIYARSLQDSSIMHGADQYPSSYIISSGPITGNFLPVKKRSRKVRFLSGNMKELFHITGYSSRSLKIEADSPLEAAAYEARQLIKGKIHNVRLLDNGGQLSLLIAFNDDISPDEHKERDKNIKEKWSGPENAGKIGSITGDIKSVTEFGGKNVDMQYRELEEIASQAIYQRYKIPSPLVTNSAATFSNVKESIPRLYDDAILPTLEAVYSGVTDFIFPRFGLDPRSFRLSYNPQTIGALKERMISELERRSKINVETTNELRGLIPERTNLGPEHDLIYHSASMIPVSSSQDHEDF